MGIFDEVELNVAEPGQPFHQLKDGDVFRVVRALEGTHQSPNNEKITVIVTLEIEVMDKKTNRVSLPLRLDVTSKRLFWALQGKQTGVWYRCEKMGKDTNTQYRIEQAEVDEEGGPKQIHRPKRPHETDSKARELKDTRKAKA